MPEVVQSFVNNKNMNEVLNLQRNIIRSYSDDMLKYADNKDKGCIKECFESIPRQLAKENKKFQYSVVKRGEQLLNLKDLYNGLKMQVSFHAAIIYRH